MINEIIILFGMVNEVRIPTGILTSPPKTDTVIFLYPCGRLNTTSTDW